MARAKSEGVAMSRRDEILVIAAKCFAQSGWDGTSMRDLADASNLMAGSLYTHFRSKIEIYEAVIASYYTNVPGYERTEDDNRPSAVVLRERLHAVVLASIENHDALSILHYDWPKISAMPELAHIVDESYRRYNQLRALIEEGIADGSLKPHLDPELVSRMIPSALHGLIDPHRYPERAAYLEGTTADDVLQVVDDALIAGLISPGFAGW